MAERPIMALFDYGHRLTLPGGYWIQKSSEDRWQVGRGETFLAFSLDSNVPVGRGGSMDHEFKRFAEAMAGKEDAPK